MSDARYVIAGLARARASWFTDLSQWANAGTVPAEFVKCVGQDDLFNRMSSSRPFSAVLLDGGLPGIDRDVVARCAASGAMVIVVEDLRTPIDWRAAGANAVLPPSFGPPELLDTLAGAARLIPRVEATGVFAEPSDERSPLRGHVIAVTGPGGVGASSVAMGIAQASGSNASLTRVLLADFCLRAELAMLHDTQVVSPGLQELVEGHRLHTLDPEQVRALCFSVDGRGYDILLGLRRKRFWTALRPSALVSAFAALTNSFDLVVVDCDADVEGETETGSADVEERNVLSRTSMQFADTVVVVGQASLKGLHTLTRVIGDLQEHGIADQTIQPIINMAPGNAKARAAYTRALSELLGGTEALIAPIFLPFQPIDEAIRAVAPLPSSFVDPLLTLVTRRVTNPNGTASKGRLERVRAGFLRRESATVAPS
jgi:septum formation inhibitor-activating ATPase MinD